MSEYPKEIRIDGLNDEQCDMLDLIYACDTSSELKEFLSCLDRREYTMALSLMTLVMYETIEVEMMEPMKQRNFYPDAVRIINKIKKS